MRKMVQKFSPERRSVIPHSKSIFKEPFIETPIEPSRKVIPEASTPDLNLMSFHQIFKQGRKLALPIEQPKRSHSVLNQSLSSYTEKMNLSSLMPNNLRPA